MSTLITIKNRSSSDFTNKQIVDVFRTLDSDVDLIVTNGKIVSAHRVVLSMYSKYMRRSLSVSDPGPRLVVSLKAFSLIVIQHVVELFYYGETRVLTSIKGQLIKALDFLEVDYDIPSNHRISSNFIPMGNVQVVTKPGEANKTTATPLNAKVVGAKPMLLQKKLNPEQQPKPNGVTKPKVADQPGQSANLPPVKHTSLLVTEKPNVSHDATSLVAVPDKSAALSLQSNQSSSVQVEVMQTPKTVESTPLPENPIENMLIGSDHTGEDTPVTEVEKVDNNITARLLNYDVDTAAAKIHSQVEAFMKELDVVMDDVEHPDDIDMEL